MGRRCHNSYFHLSKRRTITLKHVLPRSFPRIRYFGFLANRRQARMLPLCRAAGPLLLRTTGLLLLHP